MRHNEKFIKKNYNLTLEEVENLEKDSKATGLTATEILRRILDKHYKNKK